MRLNTQRDILAATLAGVADSLSDLHSDIARKISMPYGDGSRSNMVNAESDILPRLRGLLEIVGDVLDNTRKV
jgi:hypothetical protein